MRILVIAPSWVATPPTGHGPGEQPAADLAKALTGLGHDVTVFATGDSLVGCKLAWHFDKAYAHDGLSAQREQEHVSRALAYAQAGFFDVIHSNESNMGLLLIGRCPTPSVTRMNWSGTPTLRAAYDLLPADQRRRTNVCAISHSLQRRIRYLAPRKVIYNGIDVEDFPVNGKHDGPLLFLGRVCPEKGADIAIRVAARAGRKLTIAGPVTDNGYFEQRIKPRLQSVATYVGPVNGRQKRELLASAAALLMPYRAREAFGYVLVEAMACGTPCIAFDRGSPREIIEHGSTGFIVRTPAEAVSAISSISNISGATCRRRVVERFGTMTMAQAYVSLYSKMIENS